MAAHECGQNKAAYVKNTKHFESMTKKRPSEIFAIWETVKLGKFSMESEKCSEIGGKSETEGEMHHCLRGGWTPLSFIKV